ncbi:MAG: sugar ABC transporter ATP-binding protein [Candidatus Aminicenantes bacterium]|nr:sugar ABC transporter ATP-binding protein [Candidatus Aminicenantes bacterium]
MTRPPASAPVLSMQGVRKRFGATVALDGVSFDLGPGQVHALLGENGAGKSTLMKILSGALRPDEGTMALAGRPYAPEGPLEGRRGGVSMIYQELNLAPHLTVEENICLGREPNRSGFLVRAEARRRIRETLAFLHHPEIGLDEPVRRLSVGARQIVEITRALLDKARILVMDEPTSSLTLEDTERLFQIIRKLKGEGVSIIYISHFLEEVQAVADVYTVLRDGRNAGTGPIAGTSLETIIHLMVGKPVDELFPRVAHSPGEVLLSLRGLKGVRMTEPLTLELRRGEILGLAGLIGSGRTETLRTIFGLDGVERGAALVGGRPGASNPGARIKQGMGLLSEDRQGEGLALTRSLTDNITLSRLGPYRRHGLLDEKGREAAAADLMRLLGIKAAGPRGPAGSLSGGNQQKVALARLLHQQADVLLFDEPTRGIDVMSKAQIYEWIGRLAAQGKGILFVSSYFPELLGVCDRIVVFYRGRITADRPTGEWTDERLMAAATTGKA